MRVLALSTLYPNALQPNYGIFVEHRLARLARVPGFDVRVVAPVPWFFSGATLFGRYGMYARMPAREIRRDLIVEHPRFLAVPVVGSALSPFLMARSLLRPLQRLRLEFPFDVIDAHYGYPDGMAAVLLGRHFRVPVVVTARGTDLHLMPQSPLPGLWLRRLLPQAAAVVGVSEALRQAAIELGVPPHRAHTIRNGVDLGTFQPIEKSLARRKLGLQGPLILSVGHLIERKGNHLTLEALARLPGLKFAMIGDGIERRSLQELALSLGISDRVLMPGEIPQNDLPLWYSAADALVLPSSREGVPNVALESMACGTPVVATSVGGIAEVLNSPAAGVLLPDRTPDAIVAAVSSLLASSIDPEATRAHAEQFTWEQTTTLVASLLAGLLPAVPLGEAMSC